ncbi:MAG: hypothetical protein EXS46_03770 [Candidatus Taylorbacteria bacterium]|nr:hypothetical protein [Candidatus Taylorbacteria bacterium]
MVETQRYLKGKNMLKFEGDEDTKSDLGMIAAVFLWALCMLGMAVQGTRIQENAKTQRAAAIKGWAVATSQNGLIFCPFVGQEFVEAIASYKQIHPLVSITSIAGEVIKRDGGKDAYGETHGYWLAVKQTVQAISLQPHH